MSLQSESTLAELRRSALRDPPHDRSRVADDGVSDLRFGDDGDEPGDADLPTTIHPVPAAATAATVLTAAAIGIGIWYWLG